MSRGSELSIFNALFIDAAYYYFVYDCIQYAVLNDLYFKKKCFYTECSNVASPCHTAAQTQYQLSFLFLKTSIQEKIVLMLQKTKHFSRCDYVIIINSDHLMRLIFKLRPWKQLGIPRDFSWKVFFFYTTRKCKVQGIPIKCLRLGHELSIGES